MKKRIVIIGDSLSMPRPNEGVTYTSTYPYLLAKDNKYEVLNRSRRSNDTQEQLKDDQLMDDLIYLEPDIVIIQLGIVDCSPRLFSKIESKILRKLSILGQYIIRVMSKRRYILTKVLKKTYVNKNEYLTNMQNILNIAQNNSQKIIIINILDTTRKNKTKSFNFEKNIIEYNHILELLSKKYHTDLIDMYSFHEDVLHSDGIHLNIKGHKVLSEIIDTKCSK